MTTSFIQAAHARIFSFRKKSPAGHGAGKSDREVEYAQGGIDHVDLAEAGQKLIGNSSKASRQCGSEDPQVETPALRRVDLTA